MGDVPRGHERLSDPGELDKLGRSPEVQAAHDIVARKFDELLQSETLSRELIEEITELKREMFWLNSQIDAEIDKRPDAQRLALRQERTDIFKRSEQALDHFRVHQAEETEDYLAVLRTYRDQLEQLLERLQSEGEQSKSGGSS
ncbi:MAG: hypothetical protein HY567_00115 [Candidatus Kerfeldbacteria bacterium]|nr:hypothetical protein [Candidatus Kerfeldbacteria bacterium]